MGPELTFVFYLIGVICLLVAAADGRGRGFQGLNLMALGLALLAIPTLWNTAEAAL